MNPDQFYSSVEMVLIANYSNWTLSHFLLNLNGGTVTSVIAIKRVDLFTYGYEIISVVVTFLVTVYEMKSQVKVE